MSILSVRLIGDPVLRTVALPVTDFGPELAKLIDDMNQTMHNVKGVGLAAPQIGVSKRIFTYAIEGHEGHIINPVLESSDFAPSEPEGCLSVPGLGFSIERPRQAVVRGVDVNGDPLVIEASGLLAKVFQHEYDHLEGKLYVDHLRGEDKKTAMRAIRAASYQDVTAQTIATRIGSVGSAFGGRNNQ